MTPSLSIIIPIYNAAPYLVGCLQSVLCQTIQDIEVLLVDDHGQDDSMALAQQTIGDDARFRFLSTPHNAGPGAARNVGIDQARGEYVAFLDADDTLHPDFAQRMVEAARQAQADVSFCQICQRRGSRDRRLIRHPEVTAGVFDETARTHFMRHFVTYCWCYIYRRAFLEQHHLRFPAERSSEDTNFLIKTLLRVQRIASVTVPLYDYWQRETSLTQRVDERRYASKLAAMDSLLDEVGHHALVDYLYVKKAYAVGVLNYLRHAATPRVEVLRDVNRHLDEHVPAWQQNPWLRDDLPIRCVTWMLYRWPGLCVKVLPWVTRRMAMAL